MDFGVLVTVSLIWGVAAVTPGPNFFITVHTAIGTTRRLSVFTVLGIVAGTMVWSISGFLGISLLFKYSPMLYYSLKCIGGLYLMYVGFNLIFKRKKQSKHDVDKNYSAMRCFRLGLLTNLLNPKTAAFMTSLFAATIPQNAPLSLGFVCMVLICSISALWYSLIATIFSYNYARRIYDNYRKKIEKVVGAIFVGFGLKLAFAK